MLKTEVGRENIVGSDRKTRPASLHRTRLEEIEGTLSDEVRHHGFRSRVSESGGTLEVRISGPKASLRLVFDRAELDAPYVRYVVRRTLSRYRTALEARRRSRGKE